MSTTNLHVQGLTCNHCVMTVTKAVAAVPGVSAVSIDLVPHGTSTVHVDGDEAQAADVTAAITAAGYSVTD
ncbi:copper chaperone CopZ [Microbacteriaceae bacterium MWH-Ta3]|nr:copper chaperone CopZ [Microbacteriaceae bacterium MWH-Ta3]